MARELIPVLLRRGHRVRALARPSSERKVPKGAEVVFGDALSAESYAAKISPSDTLIHLVGVAHPNPAKAGEFRNIDLKSIQQALIAAKSSTINHIVYVSVAQPAPIMKEYIAVRAEGESLIRQSGMNATILRPWYVLGPGHWWPILLLPAYWTMELIPSTRESARRLGLVNTRQMTAALVSAVEGAPSGVRVAGVREIRESSYT
jgi:uncharacterized protein YbjT (DUF2867 family)